MRVWAQPPIFPGPGNTPGSQWNLWNVSLNCLQMFWREINSNKQQTCARQPLAKFEMLQKMSKHYQATVYEESKYFAQGPPCLSQPASAACGPRVERMCRLKVPLKAWGHFILYRWGACKEAEQKVSVTLVHARNSMEAWTMHAWLSAGHTADPNCMTLSSRGCWCVCFHYRKLPLDQPLCSITSH